MVARVLFVVILNAVFLIGVIWYVPIGGLLSARGYTHAQIEALKATGPPGAEHRAPVAVPEGVQQGIDSEPEPTQVEGQSTPDDQQVQDPPGSDEETDAAAEKPAAQTQAGDAGEQNGSEPEPEPQRRLVATDTINVRAGQGTENPTVGQVAGGDVVTVLEDPGGDWVRIEHADLQGWAYRPLFESAEEATR